MQEKNLCKVLKKLGSIKFIKSHKGIGTNCPLSFKHSNSFDVNPSFFAYISDIRKKGPSFGYCHACRFKGSISEVAVERFSHFKVDVNPLLEMIFKAEWDFDVTDDLDDIPSYDEIPNHVKFSSKKSISKTRKYVESYFVFDDESEHQIVDDNVNLVLPQTVISKMAYQWIGKYHSYWEYRGFGKEDFDEWGCGYAENIVFRKCKNSNWYYVDLGRRLILNIYDMKNNIVGWSGRSVDDKDFFKVEKRNNLDFYITHGKPKYFHCPGFNKTDYLFGEHRIKSDHSMAIICEGPLDAIKIYKAGFETPLAIMGGDLSNRQREIICSNFKKVIIFGDADKEGKRISQVMLEKLRPRVNTYRVDPEFYEGRDPGDLTLNEIQEILMDCF